MHNAIIINAPMNNNNWIQPKHPPLEDTVSKPWHIHYTGIAQSCKKE